MADYILIVGYNKDSSDLDKTLRQVMKITQQENLKLNHNLQKWNQNGTKKTVH